jgi:hypothetical protein
LKRGEALERFKLFERTLLMGRIVMKISRWIVATIFLTAGACGGDQKTADEQAKEVQRALQEGMQKEKQMYEGAQKSIEALERKAQEKTN